MYLILHKIAHMTGFECISIRVDLIQRLILFMEYTDFKEKIAFYMYEV